MTAAMPRLGGDTPELADRALDEWYRRAATRQAVFAAVDEVAARVKGVEPPERVVVPFAQTCLWQALAEFVPLIAEDWSRLRLAENLS